MWRRLEALLDRAGDRLNPILVKEARQAMKSRQFVITFSLLLLVGWVWTVLFIAFGLPAIYYAPVGPGVLMGYYVVLSIPLLIVVPYAAFRSLAAEQEDGTYELLSITTLSSRQIVLGKLGSAVLQMMVYYSALAPSIAFTYLLRGIDIVTIGLFLIYTFLASLLLSAFGLMMATITRARHWQVLLSVALVMILLVVTFIWDSSFLSLLMSGTALPLDSADFWLANLCLFSFYLPLVALLILIAAGQITFASENRSTPIRAVLVVPQILFAGWMVDSWLRSNEEELLFVWTVLAAVYWAIAGALLSGETAELSPRAKRRLPQSLVGRVTFTWFNPGSGTGYVFAQLGMLTMIAAGFLAIAGGYLAGYEYLPDVPQFCCFAVCLLGYVAGYLGAARLIVVAVRQFVAFGFLASFLCQLMLVVGGVLFPLVIQALISWGKYATFSYSLLQLPNFFWTIYEIIDSRGARTADLALMVGSVGGVIFLINLLLAAREVEHVRQAAPARVVEDERALHPPPERKKRNPWDDAVAEEA